MARADEIAMLIPLYQQFIARQRQIEQRQADKLRQRQTRAEAKPAAESVAAAVGKDASTDVPNAADPAVAAEEVPSEIDPDA